MRPLRCIFHVSGNESMTSLPIVVSLCIPDRPASFRNTYDAKYWRDHLVKIMGQRLSLEKALFGSTNFTTPVKIPLSLDVLHLYAKETHVTSDVDNMAKPIMDAFNGILYVDDVQVKKLQFTSVPIFSQQATIILAENNGLFGGLLVPLLNRAGDEYIGNDITLLVFRDLSDNLIETNGDYFLSKSKAGVRMNFG